MSKFTIYHNPRCGKSRDTLSRLRDAGQTPLVIEYLKTPPDAAQLDALCTALNLPPQSLVRYKEALAVELKLNSADARSREEWLQLLAENPILIERPIVVRGERAVIGRPPSNIDVLLKAPKK